jgi:tRNA pseudouridine55 synthase
MLMDAFFSVYKPAGPTSHDVVARLRRASGVRRIGHAGTLDPLAEGVLVVAAGQATRLVEYLVDAEKAYLAEVTFGVTTDTYDAEGRPVATGDPSGLTRATVEDALAQFRGTISQRPPPYSAISVGGQRLHALARRGKTVEAPLRTVTIDRLDLVSWEPPRAGLEVVCGKGTYIRSLAHDLGQALGCGAFLSRLVRQRVGPFRAAEAVPLDDLEARLREGRWQPVALAPDAVLAHLPAVRLDAPEAARIATGGSVSAAPEGTPLGARTGVDDLPSGTLGRAYAPGGQLLAVVRLGDSGGRPVWRPEKVFAGERARPAEETRPERPGRPGPGPERRERAGQAATEKERDAPDAGAR